MEKRRLPTTSALSHWGSQVRFSRDELASSARLFLGLGHLCPPTAWKGTSLGVMVTAFLFFTRTSCSCFAVRMNLYDGIPQSLCAFCCLFSCLFTIAMTTHDDQVLRVRVALLRSKSPFLYAGRTKGRYSPPSPPRPPR